MNIYLYILAMALTTYLIRVLRDARDRSLEELACALDTTPEDVEAMFASRGHALGDE